MTNIRRPIVAGQFYPSSPTQLRQQITDCFLENRGPGTLPKLGKEHPLKGLIVPHAGYIYSGAIAAHSYHQLATHGFADTFIILGPNHTGNGSGVSIMTQGTWKTPLAETPINTTLAKMLHTGIIDADETAHYYEHSIEVQLPFLQYTAANKPFTIIPICMLMQDEDTATEVGTILAETIKKQTTNIMIIASTDFSHVGFNYSTMPPDHMRVDTYATTQDKYALDCIQNLDPQELIHTVYEHNISMCGYGPVAAMLIATKKLGATKATLLKYGTSYDVHPGTSCVGYGAITIE